MPTEAEQAHLEFMSKFPKNAIRCNCGQFPQGECPYESCKDERTGGLRRRGNEILRDGKIIASCEDKEATDAAWRLLNH